MNSRLRHETAWSFREPDRVPVELELPGFVREMPEAARVAEFVDREADNFLFAGLFAWGFFGLDSEYREEVIEELPGQYKRLRRTHTNAAGTFVAVTRHYAGELDPGDFAWERRYVETLDDLVRLTEAPRAPRPFDRSAYEAALARHGDRGVSLTGLLHPLGTLVRSANQEEVYAWLAAEPRLIHRFLECTNRQVADSVRALAGSGIRPNFATWALEMLVPPWLGHRGFDEFVFPYDRAVNDAIHHIGGRHRAHCHGRCGAFLERFADMGIDALEPLEPAPFGDTDLADAKRRVGGRMLLSGNLLSQSYLHMNPAEVREAVRQAIRAGAPGGGFTLRCAEGTGGTGTAKTLDQVRQILPRVEAYIDAARDFGRYPIGC